MLRRRQALRGESLTISSNGSQTRSFCYVDDLIDGMLRLMATSADFVGPINMGNPAKFSMLQLAEMVIRLVGSRSKITFIPLPSDDPKQRKPDISLADEVMGWRPTVALEDGLKETIAYFRQHLGV